MKKVKKLINTKTEQSIVEFTEQETKFYNRILENEMREMGIPIPHGIRGEYEGKDCVRLGDETFQRAFKEIYIPTYLNAKEFVWIEH
ncbi:MAG: hypothetical protein ACKVOH_04725 [Chlamydiales bacterium]